MIEYGLSKVHIEQIVRSENYLPRDGFSSFIEKIRAKHIPLIIVTSGFTNFIEAWFQVHGFPTENITLYGNTFSFDQN
jgi:2-hydroxy-3-keto-5-methylthiopentenyl-1-phosphate phosphatase